MICVLGDAHLDVVVSARWPVAEETDTPARTAVGVGGQAANVAAWVVALGGSARLIAARGTDLAARLVADELARRGVELVGPVLGGRTGVVVSLTDHGAGRSMLTDRGIGPSLTAGSLRPEWLDGCGWLHLPAYSLVTEPVSGAALAAAERAPRLSVDLSSTAVLQAYGVARFADLIARLHPDVVFGNEAEASLVGDLAGAEPWLSWARAASGRRCGVPRAAHPAGGLDRGRRRVCRRLPRRRYRTRPAGGGAGGGDDGGDAVTFSPVLAEEVAEALRTGNPVVALETTLVSHGFSGGRGLTAARAAEERVRAAGAVPATIGIVDGTVRAGLSDADLERFAEAGSGARKVGARDIAACVVQGALGATTVGGTLAVCRALGIRFLGTGGIGGVHRGFAQTADISGDLLQIARTPAVVVCSGAKSILDVNATGELLETLGIPVLGWNTPTLPVFYSAEGGPPVPAVVATSQEVARIARTQWQLDGSSGLLLARPPASGLDIEPIVGEAVRARAAPGRDRPGRHPGRSHAGGGAERRPERRG